MSTVNTDCAIKIDTTVILIYLWRMTNRAKEIGERIKIAREIAGVSQKSLGDYVGTTRNAVSRWESGDASPASERFPAIAEHLNTTVEWLMLGNGERERASTHPEPSNGSVINAPLGQNGLLPVYGQAVAGVEGQFPMNGNILFFVVAPPQIARIDGAYAVGISGDSMFPRYEDGEIAFVNPTRRVKKGDYVVAQIQMDEHEPPQAYVKRFVRHNDEELVLSQFNPAKDLIFDHEKVVSVHYIELAGTPDKE